MTATATIDLRSHIATHLPAIYLTLVSMIQAVALEALVVRLSELMPLVQEGGAAGILVALQLIGLLLTIFWLWFVYSMAVCTIPWTLTVLDAAFPFAAGVLQLAALSLVGISTIEAWLYVAGIGYAGGGWMFQNVARRARAEPANAAILADISLLPTGAALWMVGGAAAALGAGISLEILPASAAVAGTVLADVLLVAVIASWAITWRGLRSHPAVVMRLDEGFSAVYLTLLSFLQAIALEELMGRILAPNHPADPVGWARSLWYLQAGGTFLAVFYVWFVYSTMVSLFRWSLTFADACLPFVLGILQFLAILSLDGEPVAFFLTAAVGFLLGACVAGRNILAARSHAGGRGSPRIGVRQVRLGRVVTSIAVVGVVSAIAGLGLWLGLLDFGHAGALMAVIDGLVLAAIALWAAEWRRVVGQSRDR